MYGEDGKVVALLDWELAHHGVGEADLAYQIAGIAHFALLAPPVDGIPTPDEMIAAYRQARGSSTTGSSHRCWANGAWRSSPRWA
jgi:aminoglycoside phosphotransferase (APT) family kinase protein